MLKPSADAASVLERWTAPMAFGLFALWAIIFLHGPLINDVGWQLWIGRQLNAGAVPYRDILEINPPLWFWIGAGVEWAAAHSGVGGARLLLLLFAVLGSLAIWLTFRLRLTGRAQFLVAISVPLGLLVTSPYAHLQREQFVWLTCLPLVALYARRAERAPVSPFLAVAIALLAAPGLALKHYFLLAPLALEIWLLWHQRGRPSLRPEHGALVVAAFAYSAAVVVVTPDYFRTMMPIIRLAYHGYDAPLIASLAQPGFVAAVLAAIAVMIGRRREPLVQATCVAAGAFALAFLLQGKNFPYQAVPALGSALLVALLIVSATPRAQRGLAAALGALLMAAISPLMAGPPRSDAAYLEAARGMPAGSSVAVLSSSSAAAWPAAFEERHDWPSRHMSWWMVPAMLEDERHGALPLALARLRDQLRSEAAAELSCRKPHFLLVDTRYDDHAPGRDYLGWFAREPAFAQAMTAYRERERVQYLRLFERAGEGAACDPAALRAVGG